jgi:hypothetical protein
MSIVIEDGSGLADSEAYISVVDADAHHAARGNTLWATLSEGEKEAALRRATDYLTATYRLRWKGCRVKSTQALDWPRYGICVDGFDLASDAVPAAVIKACAEMAFKAAQGELAEDLEQGVVREKIGPMETEYNPNSPQYKRYRAIDLMLAPYLNGTCNVTLVRA